MSNSVRPRGQQPTRLPRPWDSPGKNTGVGCHFLLQCMKVKNESEDAQSYLTLIDPMDCSLPGSSIHEIFPAKVLEWGAIAFSDFYQSSSLKLIISVTFKNHFRIVSLELSTQKSLTFASATTKQVLSDSSACVFPTTCHLARRRTTWT